MKGETDLGKLSKQICTRDLPSQMTLKYRQDGQGKEEEYGSVRDFKKDLDVRERKAREERNKDKAFRGSSSSSAIHSAITAGSRSTRRNIDADDPIEESDEDSSDEEDETADLLAELNKIKAEREEERKNEEQKRIEEEERIRTDNILRGNPLLNNEPAKKQTAVKRRWDDDVVFKNCARQEPEKKKNFVNDTIRSDFHRRFMYKYIK